MILAADAAGTGGMPASPILSETGASDANRAAVSWQSSTLACRAAKLDLVTNERTIWPELTIGTLYGLICEWIVLFLSRNLVMAGTSHR